MNPEDWQARYIAARAMSATDRSIAAQDTTIKRQEDVIARLREQLDGRDTLIVELAEQYCGRDNCPLRDLSGHPALRDGVGA